MKFEKAAECKPDSVPSYARYAKTKIALSKPFEQEFRSSPYIYQSSQKLPVPSGRYLYYF